MRKRFIEVLAGTEFGRWTVVEKDRIGPKTPVRCECSCGTIRKVVYDSLQRGISKSCGCLSAEKARARETVHGMTGHPLHNVWKGMLNRCRNPNGQDFKNYGGRGVIICERWNSFANFFADMGPTFVPGLTIERKNNDGDYSKENCCWIERPEQPKNRRPGAKWSLSDKGIASNTSGLRGVCWDKSRGNWIASICVNGQPRNLGRFSDKFSAHAAYKNAATALRG